MDAKIFKINLKALLDSRSMSLRDLAEQCGLGYPWVRRVCSRGLTRVEDRNREQLEAICELFKVSPIERLWSPDLHSGRDEAAWCASRLEEILNATRSLTDFSKFESIRGSSITDLKKMLDLLHLAFQQSQEELAQQHESSLAQYREKGQPLPLRPPDGSEQLRKATEYSAKLSQVFRTHSLANNQWLSTAANVIDALFFEKQKSRVVIIFRDRDQSKFEDWLVYFGDRQSLENSIAVALAKFSEGQVLEWLTSHLPPKAPYSRQVSDWNVIRDWMIATERKRRSSLSTAGGRVVDRR